MALGNSVSDLRMNTKRTVYNDMVILDRERQKAYHIISLMLAIIPIPKSMTCHTLRGAGVSKH